MLKVSVVLLVLMVSCRVFYFQKASTIHIATVNNNVCKKLKGDVVLHAIFVDSKYTNPWTNHDIESTLDSINLAMKWIEDQASLSNVPLSIKVTYHQNKKTIPIYRDFRKKTLRSTLFASGGVRSVDKWANTIGKMAIVPLGPDTSSNTKTKIKPKDRERLIAKLRDKYNTDNVALVYFINNYYTDEVSVALHTGNDDSPEYAIVSFKEPAVIAHEFLHLFGALDLYVTPWDTKRQMKRKLNFAQKEFPNEIMAFAHRNINSLEISPLSKYLIGWKNELDEKSRQFLVGRKIKVAKYSIQNGCMHNH